MKSIKQAPIGEEVVVSRIVADEETKGFLFTLGCYEGERLTVVSVVGGSYIVSIKDARYSIDPELAAAIEVE